MRSARYDGKTALHIAAQNGAVDGLALLLESPTTPAYALHCVDSAGNSPLLLAAQHNHHDVIEYIGKRPEIRRQVCSDNGSPRVHHSGGGVVMVVVVGACFGVSRFVCVVAVPAPKHEHKIPVRWESTDEHADTCVNKCNVITLFLVQVNVPVVPTPVSYTHLTLPTIYSV